MRRLGLIALLAGCDNEVDFTIAAESLRSYEAQGVLAVDVVLLGETVRRFELALDEVAEVTAPDLLVVGNTYGVAAFLDLDGDGLCSPEPTDLPWIFQYSPGVKIDYRWVPDPEESEISAEACLWFAGHPTTAGAEAMPTDSGADTDGT
jgi:hypothetical protein